MTYNTPAIDPIVGDAEAIIAAALLYNEGHPEAAAAIKAGTPIVDIYADTTDGVGASVRIIIDPGVLDADGITFLGTGYTQSLRVRSFDGRLSPLQMAKKILRREIAAVKVPVRYRGRGA